MTAEQLTASNYDYQVARNVRLAIMDSRKMQKEIALAAGMHPSSMTMSMQGKRPWRAEEVVRIALATGVEVTDLLPRLDSNQQPAAYTSSQVRALPVRHLRVVA